MFRDYNYREMFKPEEILDYLRKSQSDDPLMTVEEVLQKHENILDEWAMRHLGAKVPEENKFREIVSGETISERPEINKVLRLIESPKYKAVKVVEPQRLTRGDLEDIGRLMKLFKLTNTYVITPERVYDLRDEYDWNAFEAELKRGNDYLRYFKKIQQRGMLESVKAGNYVGSTPPYGFDKIKIKEGKKECPTLKENPEQAEVVRMIFDMYANQGLGRIVICSRLNEMGLKSSTGGFWDPTSIREILRNVHYIGKVRWNFRKNISVVENGEIKKKRPESSLSEYMVFEGKHDGIVPQELFDKAQERMGRNPRVKKNAKIRNPFAGLLYCKNCNRTMSLTVQKYPDGRDKCAPRITCMRQARCGNGSCTYEDVASKMSDVLRECIADFEIRVKNNEGNSVALHARLVKNLEQKMKDLEAKELSQWEAQAHPDPAQRMPAEIFKRLNERLLEEKEEVRQALCKAYESMPEPVDYEEKIQTFQEALDALNNPDMEPAITNELLKACIDRIDYYREKPIRQKPAKGNGTFPMIATQWNSPPIELDVQLRV